VVVGVGGEGRREGEREAATSVGVSLTQWLPACLPPCLPPSPSLYLSLSDPRHFSLALGAQRQGPVPGAGAVYCLYISFIGIRTLCDSVTHIYVYIVYWNSCAVSECNAKLRRPLPSRRRCCVG